MPFLIPPLAEQRRIVAKIEELFSDLDAGVATLERVRSNLKRYRAAVLKAAVEGKLTEDWRAQHPDTEPATVLLGRVPKPERPARYSSRSIDVIPGHAALSVGATNAALPRGWAWTPLVDVARMESGHTPSRNHPEWWDGDIPWIGILDAKAHHGRTIYETLQHTNEEGLANSAARLLPAGTICVSRTAASIGYVTLLGKPMATSQDLINWVPTEAVLPGWLRLIFMVDRQVLIRFGKGSTHKTVYYPEWLSMHVAVPPLDEQALVVSRVDEMLSSAEMCVATVEANLARAARLRQGILKRAFEGRLVPQDPADEPAEKLLERIRQQRHPDVAPKDGHPRRAPRQRGPKSVRSNMPLFRSISGDDTEGGAS
jgi:type I restriction enzyme S subunit